MLRCVVPALTAVVIAGCSPTGTSPARPAAASSPKPKTPSAPTPVAATVASVRRTLPHDRAAFTQGFAFWNGRLFEGTGLYGQSMLRELDPKTGRTLRQHALAPAYFGEGITVLDGRIYQLTWRENSCLVYDVKDFNHLHTLRYEGEGWGLTDDGASLIMSDGSDKIRFRSPTDLRITRTLAVRLGAKPVSRLNELEYIRGEIWANVWYSNRILRISPKTGQVLGILDASQLLPDHRRDDVLNGIAFEPTQQRLLLTGKRWPLLFDVVVPPPIEAHPKP